MKPSTVATIVEQEATASTLVLTVIFPRSYLYFQGHFPQIPLLPAVAQIDYVMAWVNRQFGLAITMSEMPRVKFMRPIRPDIMILVTISLNREKSSIDFSFTDKDQTIKYSSGKIKVDNINA